MLRGVCDGEATRGPWRPGEKTSAGVAKTLIDPCNYAKGLPGMAGSSPRFYLGTNMLGEH